MFDCTRLGTETPFSEHVFLDVLTEGFGVGRDSVEGVEYDLCLKHTVIEAARRFYLEGVFLERSVSDCSATCLSSLVYKDRFETLEALWSHIRATIDNMPVDMLEKVAQRFRNRLHQCIDNGGRHLTGIVLKTI
ncbi:hypothetical protein TNCV_4233411 [Trichonephila clavipes]|nr:hypothetical protein TNCV_4233411 [Trichonephila clavipes]